MEFLFAILFFIAIALLPSVFLAGGMGVLFAPTRKPMDSSLLDWNGSFLESVPGVALSTVVWLLSFSLVGRLIPNSYVAGGLATAAPLLCGLLVLWRTRQSPLHALKRSLPALVLVLALTLLFWVGRFGFARIEWDPARSGAEKLFNLAHFGGFLQGKGYPPEVIWMAGESSKYYVLPKALPGFAAWLSDTWTGHNGSHAVLFYLGDAFYFALGVATAAGGAAGLHRLLNEKSNPITNAVWAFCAGLFPLLVAPAKAFVMAKNDSWNLWGLTRVITRQQGAQEIENTITEYPFWNWIWADNHAHGNAAFLDVTLPLWLILIWRHRKNPALNCFLTPAFAMTVAATYLSHSGSLYAQGPCIVVFAIAVFLSPVREVTPFRGYMRRGLSVILTYLPSVILTGLLLLPDLLKRSQPSQLVFYFVQSWIASSFLEFLNINMWPVLILVCLLFLTFPFQKVDWDLKTWVLYLLPGLTLWIGGWEALAAVWTFSWLLSRFLAGHPVPEDAILAQGSLWGFMCIWMTPEIYAMNFNMGDIYMRYNSLFRSHFTSIWMFPIWMTVCFSLASARHIVKRWRVHMATGIVCAGTVVFLGIQFRTWLIPSRDPSLPFTPNALEFLKTRHPGDWGIIQWLNTQPRNQRMVLAEICGSPYTQSGRIAAYSGRPGLCGWLSHTQQFQNTVDAPLSPQFAGRSAWDHLNQRKVNIDGLLHSALEYEFQPRDAEFIEMFKQLKVTHIVLGELEQQQQPGITLDNLARFGKIVWQDGPYGVVEFNPEEGLP